MANDKKTGGNATILSGGGQIDKPLNILSAVAEIQSFSVIERDSLEEINPNALNIVHRMDFYMVGLKGALLTGLLGITLIPFSIGILDNLIPVFGDIHLTPFDDIFAFFLLVGPSLSYGIFISGVSKCYVGSITRGMIKNLLSGLILGEILKIFIFAVLFSYIYLKFNKKEIFRMVYWFSNRYYHSQSYWKGIYDWLVKFRNVFPTSIVIIIISGFFMAGIPIIRLYFKYKKDKKNMSNSF
jgi:hypothetical protein